jgi:hypothetical protein
MTDREAMAMALDALQFALHVGFDESSGSQIKKGDKAGQQHRQAITVLKERLAQPHETTLKEFNQLIHDDPKYHIWAKGKEALADPMREVQRLGQEIEQEPPQRTEQNFCSRCGKRTKDLTHIHTCTPPQENT